MEWHPAGQSMCQPLLIFPCTIKSRSSLLAPAHPGGPGKGVVKRLWWCGACYRMLMAAVMFVHSTATRHCMKQRGMDTATVYSCSLHAGLTFTWWTRLHVAYILGQWYNAIFLGVPKSQLIQPRGTKTQKKITRKNLLLSLPPFFILYTGQPVLYGTPR